MRKPDIEFGWSRKLQEGELDNGELLEIMQILGHKLIVKSILEYACFGRTGEGAASYKLYNEVKEWLFVDDKKHIKEHSLTFWCNILNTEVAKVRRWAIKKRKDMSAGVCTKYTRIIRAPNPQKDIWDVIYGLD